MSASGADVRTSAYAGFSHLAVALGRNFAGVHKYAAKQGLGFGRRSRRDPTPTLADILALAGS